MSVQDRHLHNDIVFLYGEEQAGSLYERIEERLADFQRQHPQLSDLAATDRISEKDSILITYGDMVQDEGKAPLQTLANFLDRHLKDVITTIHILPFFPYSSDDGFSVIDYRVIDPKLGNWNDVIAIGLNFRLMYDAVVNHISAESAWFKEFLENISPYRDYFIVVEPGADLSQVFRPRALPLLTPVKQLTDSGGAIERLVWTTFSADQIDLNFRNPKVLLEVLDILLLYVQQGAEFIRLDAIAYIWKEIGTSCIHLPQTHRIIQLIRRVLDRIAPRVALITETNVPHEDNISYFGDGTNEAQMVYNFSLPPLTLHTFHTGNAETLSHWAASLTLPSDQVTFFNFLASHDGIGLTPARGILSEASIVAMAQRVAALGGFVSEKSNSDGSTSPYELNINFLDALGRPDEIKEDTSLVARRFLASQAIMLAMQGVPGIYFHSLFGSRGWPQGVNQSGHKRTINRQKLQRAKLEVELADTHSLRHQVYHSFRHLLSKRQQLPAFHPNGGQQVLFCHEALFCLLRTAPDGRSHVLCLHNVTPRKQVLRLPLTALPCTPHAPITDHLSNKIYASTGGSLRIPLDPYQVIWLRID